MRLLVVEDERRIAAFLMKGLRAHGYEVDVAETGADALEQIGRAPFDLVLLDLQLPDMDGLRVLRKIRAEPLDVAIVIVTARGLVEDRVEGLNLGADDYVTKPFAFDEVLARVRSQLRPRPDQPAGVLAAAGVKLDLRTRRAIVDGREVDLSRREFSVLETLMRHPGQVLSRGQLLAQAWGNAPEAGSNVVAVYVGYLRRKLGRKRIETVPGVGYRLVDLRDGEDGE
jgi:DNA-binding response OmpR family regulator